MALYSTKLGNSAILTSSECQRRHASLGPAATIATMLRNLSIVGWLMGVLIASSLALVPAAEAAPQCRTVADHQVCILKITRSAKYYWEYRAIVQIDDERRPVGRYNCRTHEYVSRDGKHIPNDVGTQVICSFFKQ
ncbi:MAG: hypothetical protein AAF959_16585 [Cyanobacteria bacterium P01_D01_bin.56]